MIINELSYMLFRVSTCGHPGEYGSNISHETVDLTKHSTYMPYIPSLIMRSGAPGITATSIPQLCKQISDIKQCMRVVL